MSFGSFDQFGDLTYEDMSIATMSDAHLTAVKKNPPEEDTAMLNYPHYMYQTELSTQAPPKEEHREKENTITFTYDFKDQVFMYLIVIMIVVVVALLFKVSNLSSEISLLKQRLVPVAPVENPVAPAQS